MHGGPDGRQYMTLIRKPLKTGAVTLILLTGFVLFQRAALADVTLQLVGTDQSFNMGGVYTSPYQIDLNGATTPLALVCDDFTTDISIGYSWSASVYTLSDVTATGPQKFTQTTTPTVTYPNGPTPYSYTIQEDYDAAAWLAYQIFTAEVPSTTTPVLDDQEASGEYSYAIWQIFDPTAFDGYGGNHLNSAELTAVTTDMSDAFSFASTLQTPPSWLSDIYIFTPQPKSASQEFIGVSESLVSNSESVPEGSTPALLAFDLLALAGGILLVRRRGASAS
jgi:hypothetical protein